MADQDRRASAAVKKEDKASPTAPSPLPPDQSHWFKVYKQHRLQRFLNHKEKDTNHLGKRWVIDSNLQVKDDEHDDPADRVKAMRPSVPDAQGNNPVPTLSLDVVKSINDQLFSMSPEYCPVWDEASDKLSLLKKRKLSKADIYTSIYVLQILDAALSATSSDLWGLRVMESDLEANPEGINQLKILGRVPQQICRLLGYRTPWEYDEAYWSEADVNLEIKESYPEIHARIEHIRRYTIAARKNRTLPGIPEACGNKVKEILRYVLSHDSIKAQDGCFAVERCQLATEVDRIARASVPERTWQDLQSYLTGFGEGLGALHQQNAES